MKYIKEYKSFEANEGDTVLIHYWYNDMVTPVKILKKEGRKYLVSHNVDSSEIRNAPDEYIKKTEMIDHVR